MVLVSNEPTSIQGNPTNPGIFFRAPDYNTSNAEIANSTKTKISYYYNGVGGQINSDYFEDKVVRGKYVGQELMETNWMPCGTLVNGMLPALVFEGQSEYTGASASAVSYYDSLKITILKRQPIPGGYIPGETTELYVRYNEQISRSIGSMPNAEWVNRASTQFLLFDMRYEYKFIVSIHRLTNNAYIDLSYMYIQPHLTCAAMTGRQKLTPDYFHLQGAPDDMPLIAGIGWYTTTDVNGTFIGVPLRSEYYDGTGGLVPGIMGNFANIISTVTTRAYGSSSDHDNTLLTSVVYDYDIGNYNLVFDGYNFGSNTTEYFYTIIYGNSVIKLM